MSGESGVDTDLSLERGNALETARAPNDLGLVKNRKVGFLVRADYGLLS